MVLCGPCMAGISIPITDTGRNTKYYALCQLLRCQPAAPLAKYQIGNGSDGIGIHGGHNWRAEWTVPLPSAKTANAGFAFQKACLRRDSNIAFKRGNKRIGL